MELMTDDLLTDETVLGVSSGSSRSTGLADWSDRALSLSEGGHSTVRDSAQLSERVGSHVLYSSSLLTGAAGVQTPPSSENPPFTRIWYRGIPLVVGRGSLDLVKEIPYDSRSDIDDGWSCEAHTWPTVAVTYSGSRGKGHC